MIDLTKERTRWDEQAECRDSELNFFEIEDSIDQVKIPDPVTISECLELCKRCPLIERCLLEAYRTKAFGIWGGTTAEDRGLRYRPLVPGREEPWNW